MADKKKDAAMKHMGEVKPKEGKEKRHVDEMHIKRGAKGGFVVHHDMKGGEKEHEEKRTGPHVIANADDLHDHIDEHMGDQPAAGEGEAPGGADPAAAAPAPGAGPDPTQQVGQGM
jgi:hypothetical protein